MITGEVYIETVNAYFSFLIEEFNFIKLEEEVRGNVFYDVRYKNITHLVSVSYENIEDYFLVIIFILQDGQLPDYDDKTHTLHLNEINARVLPQIPKNEISLNNEHFLKFSAKDELQRKLLKSAKELRLCLKHLDEISLK